MSRRRYISTDISRDKDVNRLAREGGDFAALLYTWLIPHAADDASLPSDPEEILYMVMPGRREKSVEDITAALEKMREIGLILWDDAGLRFDPESFYRYQTYIQQEKRAGAQPRTSPEDSGSSAKRRKTPQNAADQRESPESSGDRRESPPIAASPSPSLRPSSLHSEGINSVVRKATKPAANDADTFRFETIWDAYPKSRRLKKAACLAIWRGLHVDDATYAEIAAGLDAWKASAQWQDERFVVYIERWLRDRRWESAPPVPTPLRPKFLSPYAALVPDDMPDENGYVKVVL